MSHPDFRLMSQDELRDYFLSHREDRDAFYAYVDRLHTEGDWVEMPPLESLQDLARYPEFTKRFQDGSTPKDSAA
ncbi:DUF6887 family protein [Altericista sp. CCNU0014]|uniref:DUF6887 family protein n=1 Tax=Altericista sp. CCNU0014 TaxID=3082949 RepID=UPI00384F4A0F